MEGGLKRQKNLFRDAPPAAPDYYNEGDMGVDMTVSDALCALDQLECWRQPATEEIYSEDHPEIEFELNSVQLNSVQLSRASKNCEESSPFKIPGVPPPTSQQEKYSSANPYLKHDANYHQTRGGKVKLTFELKRENILENT